MINTQKNSKWPIGVNVAKMTKVDNIVVIDSIRLVVLSSARIFILTLSSTSTPLRLLILIEILIYFLYDRNDQFQPKKRL